MPMMRFFSAKIHPLRPASSLSDTDQRNLFEAIEHVLTEGIKAGGASEENFVNALGEKGFYQERFLVYKKNGSLSTSVVGSICIQPNWRISL